MTLRKTVPVTLAALAMLPSIGQAQSAPSASTAAVLPGSYTVEPSHTRILFAVSHLGLTTWYGEFTKAAGTLTLNPSNPGASTVDISVSTASISTSNSKLDEELKAADWFDAQRFPIIRFQSARVITTGANTANITGDLTFHGVTKPVTLQAKFNGAAVNPLDKAYTSGFEISGDIKRSDFGVSKYVPLVGDNVHLIISAAFVKKPA